MPCWQVRLPSPRDHEGKSLDSFSVEVVNFRYIAFQVYSKWTGIHLYFSQDSFL